MIVIDSSAIVHTLAAEAVDEALVARVEGEALHAPHLLDVEVLHALRGLELGNKISAARADHARALYRRFRIIRYSVPALADRIWSLRHSMTAYDATYVALAEVLGCPVVTKDGKLSAGGHGADIAFFPPSSER